MSEVFRHGNFSSSSIWKLMEIDKQGGFGKPAKTYIKAKQREIALGRAVTNNTSSRETSWGHLVEKRAFDLLDTKYRLVSKERLVHPTISRWNGMPDTYYDGVVADIKCPFTLTAFCDKLEALAAGTETYKKEFPEDYWQLVSNSILTGVSKAEAIIYVPYKDEIEIIREMVQQFDGDQNKVAWLNWAYVDELPYLIEGMKYKNLNVIQFEVPKSDKEALTERVKLAVQQLDL